MQIIYSDDTLLFFSGSSITEIESRLSVDLSSILNWLDNNFLFLNYTKTKTMLVGIHQRLAKVTSFCVFVSRKSFSRAYEFKYLGVVLDPNSPGTTTSIIFPPKYHPGWVCFVKHARSFHERFVSYYTTPWYFLYLTIAVRFGEAVGKQIGITQTNCNC